MITTLNENEGTKFPTMQEMRARAYDVLASHAHNTTATYDELAVAMGADPQTSTRARAAVLSAGRKLLPAQNKKIVNVRNEGYRIALPNEQVGVSRKEQARARRWLRESLKTVTHIALDDLSPQEIAKAMTEQARAAIQVSMSRRLTMVKTLPAKEDLALPSPAKLVEMMRRKKAS
jgi:hypothetical protein